MGIRLSSAYLRLQWKCAWLVDHLGTAAFTHRNWYLKVVLDLCRRRSPCQAQLHLLKTMAV